MKIATLVFARLDSRRLPGKVLMPLGGRSILDLVVTRAKRAGLPVVVATSDRPVDDPIAQAAGRLGVEVYRGSADDVLVRALACAGEANLDAIVRISADSPFMPSEVIRDVLQSYMSDRDVDIVTNVFPRSYPKGASVEVIPTTTLRRIADLTRASSDREHVTQYVYANPGQFRIRNINHAESVEHVSICVDTEVEYNRARAVVEQGIDDMASMQQVLGAIGALDLEGQAIP